MRLTDGLNAEHAVLRRLFAHANQHLEPWTLPELRAGGATIAAALLSHAALEDEFLFTALAPLVGDFGPVAVMRDEHEQIDAAFARLDAATEVGEARQALRLALRLSRDHFATEEAALFPIAGSLLPAVELERLGDAWALRCKPAHNDFHEAS